MPRGALHLVTLAALAIALGGCNDRTVAVRQDSGFRTTDIVKGNGLLVDEGCVVTVHYTVKLPDGTAVIDTHAMGRSHTFRVGGGTVVAGMDKLVRGMRTGGVREGRVPPSYHYGSQGHGGKIPPNTMLTFRVELVDVRSG